MKARLPHAFIRELQQFNIWDVLQNVWALSRRCLDNESGVPYIEKYRPTNSIMSYPIIVPPWSLIDIAYHACKNCTKHAPAQILSNNALFSLLNQHNGFSEEEEKEYDFMKMKNPGNERDLLLFLYGFFGEQAKFQAYRRVLSNFTREIYVLQKIAPVVEDGIDIESIVQHEIGLSSDTVSLILYYLFFVARMQPDVLNFTIPENKYIKPQDIQKVVSFYSTTIEEVQNSKLGRQIFYSKPFLQISASDYICVNAYLPLFLFERSTYWICRNHYFSINSNAFLKAFGEYYESYVEELFHDYLDAQDYEKIPEGQQERADWKLNIGGYTFLMEQKSAFLEIRGRQQHFDMEVAHKYITRNWVKALKQLHTTELALGLYRPIKIILTYDDYYKPEVLEQVFHLESCKVIDDGYYWLLSTGDLEKMLYLWQQNPVLFKKIISEKIELETAHSHEGREMSIVLERNGITENLHMKQEKYMRPLNNITDTIKVAFGKAPATIRKDSKN